MILNDKKHDEGEEGEDVYETAHQGCYIGVIEEHADEVAHCYDGQAVIRKVQEQECCVRFGKDVTHF